MASISGDRIRYRKWFTADDVITAAPAQAQSCPSCAEKDKGLLLYKRRLYALEKVIELHEALCKAMEAEMERLGGEAEMESEPNPYANLFRRYDMPGIRTCD